MQPFTEAGQFWLPETPDRSVPGEVVFDRSGLRVTLFEPLTDPLAAGQVLVGGPHQVSYERVHARFFDGDEATVVGVTGFVDRRHGSADREEFGAEVAFLGGHVTADAFSAVQVGFDLLTGWTWPAPTAETAEDGRRVLNVEPQTFVEVKWQKLTILLRSYAVGRHGDDVHLDQQARVEIQGPAAGVRELIDDRLQPLHDLLLVLIGDPVVITDIRVRVEGAGPRDAMMKMFFHSSQPEPSARVGSARFRNWDSRTLVVREDDEVDLGGLIASWLEMYGDLGNAIQLLNAPLYAPFMYVDTRFSFAFQAVEQIAKARFRGQDRPKAEHDDRVAGVVTTLKNGGFVEDDLAWVRGRLESGNFKKLTTLLQELFASTGSVGKVLLDADAPRVFAGVRGSASHGAPSRRSAEEKYWFERALSWVARVDLLAAVGVPLDVLTERVLAKPEFSRAVEVVQGP